MTVLTLQDMATQPGVAFGTSGARGKVADMTLDLCHAYTTAFLNAVVPKASSIVLGHDLRPSIPLSQHWPSTHRHCGNGCAKSTGVRSTNQQFDD